FFVGWTLQQRYCQASLADIDSGTTLSYCGDRYQTRPSARGGSRRIFQHFASRARSTIPGSMSASRTSLTCGVSLHKEFLGLRSARASTHPTAVPEVPECCCLPV